jgi:hypothetical protein
MKKLTLQTFPEQPQKETYTGTIDEILKQVKIRLEYLSQNAPAGEQTISMIAIVHITISNHT